jgi:putative tryptophan/tyrosine transport system substrate-binding protein
MIRRREFISLLGGAAAWPLAARAQQPALPVIGFLSSETPSGYAFRAAALRQGLGEAGYVEGRDVTIEYRWAEGQYDRLPALAADLVRRQVAVIAAAGTRSALAARAATTTIPIVFSTAADPIAEGLVASLAQPGGNATGVNNLAMELVQKEMEKLHQMVPTATVIAALVNPTHPPLAEPATKEAQAAGRTLGLKVHIIQASTERDIDAAFATLLRLGAGGLVVCPDTFFTSRRDQIAALAIRHAIPVIYHLRELPAAGGLMSYGPSATDGYRRVGIYAARILKGERPDDLPVQRATKFDLVINLTTAKVLGLEVPFYLQQLADEVIE